MQANEEIMIEQTLRIFIKLCNEQFFPERRVLSLVSCRTLAEELIRLPYNSILDTWVEIDWLDEIRDDYCELYYAITEKGREVYRQEQRNIMSIVQPTDISVGLAYQQYKWN